MARRGESASTPSAPLPANGSTTSASSSTPRLCNALNTASRTRSVVGRVARPAGATRCTRAPCRPRHASVETPGQPSHRPTTAPTGTRRRCPHRSRCLDRRPTRPRSPHHRPSLPAVAAGCASTVQPMRGDPAVGDRGNRRGRAAARPGPRLAGAGMMLFALGATALLGFDQRRINLERGWTALPDGRVAIVESSGYPGRRRCSSSAGRASTAGRSPRFCVVPRRSNRLEEPAVCR